METRHTPGPWVAALEGNVRPLIIQDLTGRPIPIASIIHQGGGDFDPSETTQVNAHLIAAAPELLAALRRATWALMLPVIILVGLRMGVFTPTEAAVVAAVYALLVGVFIYREIKPAFLYRALVRTGVTSGIVMLISCDPASSHSPIE